MLNVNLADAKTRLSELVDRAENGEEIVITRHGQPVARLSAMETPKKPIRSMAEFRARMPKLKESLSESLRKVRDEQR
jgi:prevent-host-death family protein